MAKQQTPWDQNQLNILQSGLRAGLRMKDIAEAMGRSLASVSNIIQFYQLKPDSPPVVYRDQRTENRLARQAAQASMLAHFRAMAESLPKKAPDVTAPAPVRDLKAWTKEEEAVVRDRLAQGRTFDEIGAELGRTAASVKSAAHSKGLTLQIPRITPPATAKRNNQAHPDETNQAIVEAYQAGENLTEMALRLGVSGNYIMKQVELFGLEKRGKGRSSAAWTTEKLARLVEMKRMDPPMTSQECADALGVSKAAVDIKSSRLKLMVNRGKRSSERRAADTEYTCTHCKTTKPVSAFSLSRRGSPSALCCACSGIYSQKHKYGVPRPAHSTCEVCGTSDDLHLDHNHATGAVRGVLCLSHNTGLGLAKDSSDVLRRMADFVETARTGLFAPEVPISTAGAGDITPAERNKLRTYGLSVEAQNKMKEAQGNACGICKTPFSSDELPHVDHCHATLEIRGMLCHNCNSSLGQFADNVAAIRKAANYLDNPPGIRVEVPPLDTSPIEDLCSRFAMEAVPLPCGLQGAKRDTTLVVLIDGAQHNRRLLLTRDGVPTRKASSWLADWQAEQQLQNPDTDVLLIRRDQMGASLDSILNSRFTEQEKWNGRELTVRPVPSYETKHFLDTYHLQGHTPAPLNFGLYTEQGELVSLMTFNDPKVLLRSPTAAPFKGWYLQRFCSRGRVRGGASKLLAAFQSAYPSRILTHSDPAYSAGGLYETLGFQKITEPSTDYIYWKEGRYHGKSTKQKSALVKELQNAGLPYDQDATEQTLAQLAGYDRIDLPGKIRWEWAPASAPTTP